MKFKTFDAWKAHFLPGQKRKRLTPAKLGREIAKQALAKLLK